MSMSKKGSGTGRFIDPLSPDPIRLGRGAWLHPSDLVFRASRAGGPGGQNVNKVNTRVSLSLDISTAQGLRESHRKRLAEILSGQLSGSSVLTVTSASERSQWANRRAALTRLVNMMSDALVPDKIRVATGVPESQKTRRLENKKHRALLKACRKGTVLIIICWLLTSCCMANISRINACMTNMRTLESAIEMYDMDSENWSYNSLKPGDYTEILTRLVEDRYIKSIPQCKMGGHYVFRVAREDLPGIICSVHGSITEYGAEIQHRQDIKAQALPKTVVKCLLTPLLLWIWFLIRFNRQRTPLFAPGARFETLMLLICITGMTFFLASTGFLPVNFKGSSHELISLATGGFLIFLALIPLCALRWAQSQAAASARRAAASHAKVSLAAIALIFIIARSGIISPGEELLTIIPIVLMARYGLSCLDRMEETTSLRQEEECDPESEGE